MNKALCILANIFRNFLHSRNEIYFSVLLFVAKTWRNSDSAYTVLDSNRQFLIILMPHKAWIYTNLKLEYQASKQVVIVETLNSFIG